MGILRRIGKPGESVRLLAFGDNFKTFEIMKGWTKYARYLDNSSMMEGIELNESGPLVEKSMGKIKGYVYPVDYDKGQGFKFDAPNGVRPSSSYIESRKFSIGADGELVPNDEGLIEKTFHVEIYPGVPVNTKKGMHMVRVVKFDISPERVNIKTNPKLIGHSVSSEILSNAIRLKPMRWQIIVAAAVAFLLGFMFGG